MTAVTVPAPAVEVRIARDLARHGLLIAPVAATTAAVFGGVDGAASALLGVAVVVLNFLVAGAMLGWAAKVSTGALMGAAFGGFVLRLGALVAAFFALRGVSWIDFAAFGYAMAAALVVLLVWEARVVGGWLSRPWELEASREA